MTENYKKAARIRRNNMVEILLPILGTAVMALFLVCSGYTSEAVVTALKVGISSVIPAVFPCMVLSKLVVSLGGGKLFSRLFGGLVERAFGLSRSAATPIIIGALCGFPLGAMTATELYSRKELSRVELERIIGFVSLPSPAFVINAVGSSMLGDRMAGVLLYFVLLIVSLFVGAVICRIGRCQEKKSSIANFEKRKSSIAEIISDAIGSSAVASLKICAYIAFFSALTAIACRISGATPMVSTLIGGFFEFSSGCFSAAHCGATASLPLCALILGWSGLGIHFQVMSVCPKGISYKWFYITLALRAAFCFLIIFFVK